MAKVDSRPLETKRHSVHPKDSGKVYGKRGATPAILNRESTGSELSITGYGPSVENDSNVLVKAIEDRLAVVKLDEDDHGSPQQISASCSHAESEEREDYAGNDTLEADASNGHNNSKDGNSAISRPARKRSHEIPKSKKHETATTAYVENRTLHSYVRPILEQAVSTIASSGVQQFDSWARAAGSRFRVEKIAEGSYGEVYQLRLCDDISKRDVSKSKLSKLKAYGTGIFKIVPLRAPKGPGSKKFTSVDEIVSEVQMLRLLDPVPGFARFREVHVVQGRFPKDYQDAWLTYSRNNDDCFNPDPGKKKNYPGTQLWAILEMDHAGYELEKFACSSVSEIYDIFWGVALGLARAEQLSEFEHRDLHLGNVCIKRNTKSRSSRSTASGLDTLQTGFGLSGLETTIIDYSLSRAELQQCYDVDESRTAWSDLDKKGIFDAVGRDDEEKCLRNTYRQMRSHIYQNNLLDEEKPPKNPTKWKSYNPGTNLTWLSFVLTILLKRFKMRATPAQRQPLGGRDANRQIVSKKMKNQKTSSHAPKMTTPDLNPPDSELEDELLERLEAVTEFLDVESGTGEFTCAGDLVATAIGLDWLTESDFLC